MKKMKYLRSWLVVALVVTIIGSLTGGTVAWFTDNVESTNNVIQSGILDIDIELKDGQNWISLEKEPNTKVFDYDLWEPGYTQVETLKIVNRGNLALEYMLNVKTEGADEFTVTVDNETVTKTLANAIDVYMKRGEVDPTTIKRSDITEVKGAEFYDYLNGWWYCGTLADLMADEAGFTQGIMLPSGAEEGVADGEVILYEKGGIMQGYNTCTVALSMDTEAGNEYQNLSLGNVGFILKAKQYMYEEDSFDETYDKDAQYGAGSIVSDIPRAKVTSMDDNKLPTLMPVYDIKTFQQTGEYVALDVGYTFEALDDAASAANNPYAAWHADFVVTFGDDLEANTCGLAGQYDFWDIDWIALNNPVNAKEGDQIRLLNDSKGIKFNYVELCEQVKVFNCGVYNLDEANVGKSITVQLRLYEPAGDYENNPNTNTEEETGRYITLATFVYKLEAVQDANK